jgi:hypothetical protein
MEPERFYIFTEHEECRLLLAHPRGSDSAFGAVHDLVQRNTGVGNNKSGQDGDGILLLDPFLFSERSMRFAQKTGNENDDGIRFGFSVCSFYKNIKLRWMVVPTEKARGVRKIFQHILKKEKMVVSLSTVLI